MMSVWNLLWIVPLTGCISVAVMALCVVASRGDEEEDPMIRKPCPDDRCPYDECGIYHTGTCYMTEEDDL